MANWMSRAHAVLDAQAIAAPTAQRQDRRYCWVLYRRGLPPLEVRFLPEVSREEAEARYPGAIAKEPEAS